MKSCATPLAGLIVAKSETVIVGTSPLRLAVEYETTLVTVASVLLITAGSTSSANENATISAADDGTCTIISSIPKP